MSMINGLPPFDPSKMDPQVLMELSRLVQQLPPEKLNQMQTLMHNMMAGHDVSREMEEFEKTLPPGFRDKLMGIMMNQQGAAAPAKPSHLSVVAPTPGSAQPVMEPAIQHDDLNLHEARLTVLRAVAKGEMTPEDADRILFGT